MYFNLPAYKIISDMSEKQSRFVVSHFTFYSDVSI